MSARASATRCAWPPEIWVGLRRSKPWQLDELEHVGDAVLDLAVLDPLATQPERDVLEDREVREERVVLEDRVDVALVGRQPGHVLALELDEAGRRLLEAADHPQGGGLAAARRAEEAEELPVLDLEVDVVDGDGVAEALDHIHEPDVDGGHGRSHSWASGGRRPRGTTRGLLASSRGAGPIGPAGRGPNRVEDMGASRGVSRNAPRRAGAACAARFAGVRHARPAEFARTRGSRRVVAARSPTRRRVDLGRARVRYPRASRARNEVRSTA